MAMLGKSCAVLLLSSVLILIATAMPATEAEDSRDLTETTPSPNSNSKENENDAQIGAEEKNSEGNSVPVPQAMEKYLDIRTYADQVSLRGLITPLALAQSQSQSNQLNSLDSLIEELERWEAPEEMRKNYPYYLSGYDEEERPIWVAELGRWNLRKMVEEGGETLLTFDKYLRQAFYRALKSLPRKQSPDDDDGEPELVFIGDFDGLALTQMAHVQTLAYVLRLAKDMEPLLSRHTFAGYIVNANFVTERLTALVRPILGVSFEKIEVFGVNSAKWIPRLLRDLPKDQIPSWYGGSKQFKPAAVYG